MVIATDPLEQFPYVCKADRKLEPSQQTTWMLLAIGHSQRSKLSDAQAEGTIDEEGEITGFRHFKGSTERDLLLSGLRGVENFCDKDGSEIQFEPAKTKVNVFGKNVLPPSDGFLDRIPEDTYTELADAIRRNTRVTAEEGKD